MKKIEVIINPEKKEDLEAVFENLRVGGVIISNVVGYGNQKGVTGKFRGSDTKTRYLSKIRAETVVTDDMVDKIIEDIVDEIQTGRIGDGKIFVYEVCEAVRIRTGEMGNNAL